MSLVRCVYHLLLTLLTELRELVNILPLVGAIRHAEGEVEFELGKDFSAEEVFLDQSQVRQRLITIHISELQVELQVPQLEKGPGERVLQYSHIHRQTSAILHLPREVVHLLVLLSRDLQQLRAGIEITDAVLAESYETIVSQGAQDALRRLLKRTSVVDREFLHHIARCVDFLILFRSCVGTSGLDHFKISLCFLR